MKKESKAVKVSIIIPVYNAEKHLKRALDSACKQTFNEIEIICINDGSTDRSVKIIREYQQNDERIKLIEQLNQGAAAARQTGLQIAKGEFMCPLDADDWLDIDAVELGFTKAVSSGCDAVLFERVFINDHGVIYGKINMDNTQWPITGETALKKTIGGWGIHASGLFKTDLMLKCSLKLQLKSINADEFLTRLFYNEISMVDYISSRYYYYDNIDSTVRKFKKSWWTYLDTQREIRKFLKNNGKYKKLLIKCIHGDLSKALELQYYLTLHTNEISDKDHSFLSEQIRMFVSEIPKIDLLKVVFFRHHYHKMRFYSLLSSLGLLQPFAMVYYRFKIRYKQ